ncbi:hypothetical protein [Cellvibrio zantedeschiae]|uniref:hypothetical protein n=1 Tax=Cellvibrio zantedeschiae TaxID=1237077 RepID=UPI00167C02CB|nr:hypothetical protein [Cellvibrio zantedeschiae]
MIKLKSNNKSKSRNHSATAILLILFGAYFLMGAFVSFSSGKWPIFMPPQFDIIALFFTLVDEKIATYIAGSALFIFGFIFCYSGSRYLLKAHHKLDD